MASVQGMQSCKSFVWKKNDNISIPRESRSLEDLVLITGIKNVFIKNA